MTETVVAEITRRGKLIYAEPYFEAGLPLLLEPRARAEVDQGDLVVVRRGKPRSRVERVLGRADQIEAVLDGVLVERGRLRPFEPFELPAPPRDERVDLRELMTFTIDPDTAKDFDDAISVRREEGGVRVWVHIADVTAFLDAGVPLDYGAAERSFSTYVPGRVSPMLPPLLSEDVCSLRPHQERLCVTTEVLLGESLQPVEPPRFYRSVILSRARLTYGQVERILGGREPADADVAQALALADEVSAGLRELRFGRGALRVETPEVNFAFDGEGGVERAWIEREPRAHALVEELMILNNEAAARFLSERRRATLYRVHESPDPQSLAALLSRLAALEVPTPAAPDTDSLSPSDAARLAAAVAERVGEYTEQAKRGREAFPSLVLRSLKQARYDPRNLGHSGLASGAYCHFTSPIRRYPDVIAHRALLAELGLADEPAADLGELAEHASAVEREAAQIEYLADEICLAWLLERTLRERGYAEPFEGEITGMIGSGLFVRFGEVFEGFLPARLLGSDYFELDPLATAMVGRRGGGRYRLGDGIEVGVERIERSTGKVSVQLGSAMGGRESGRSKQRASRPKGGKAKGGRGRQGRGGRPGGGGRRGRR